MPTWSAQIINIPEGGQMMAEIEDVHKDAQGWIIGTYQMKKYFYSPSWREWFVGDPPSDRTELDQEW